MLYFKLFESTKLKEFSAFQKHKIINLAVKKSREDFPINIQKRLLVIFGVSFCPALIIYLLMGFELSFAFLVVSICILNIKVANDETPSIEPYLEKAIDQYDEEKKK
jgi:hypothetical protein